MGSYHTVYEISPITGDLLGFILTPLLFIVFGIAMVKGWVEFKGKRPSKYFGYFFIGFSLLGEILLIVDSSTKYVDMKRELRSGQYRIVEGGVEDFVPLRDFGK